MVYRRLLALLSRHTLVAVTDREDEEGQEVQAFVALSIRRDEWLGQSQICCYQAEDHECRC